MSEIDLDNVGQAWEMGERLRDLADLAADPLALAHAINAVPDDDVNALLLCAVIILADYLEQDAERDDAGPALTGGQA